MIIIRKIKGKNARSKMVKMYPIIKDEKLPIKSITVDNGLKCQMMGITAKQFNFKVYYYQPYSSFQRCTNENINGIVRRWYKKGTNFSLVSEYKIKTLEWSSIDMWSATLKKSVHFIYFICKCSPIKR